MKRVLEVITLASSAEAFIGNQFSQFQATGEYEMHLICSYGPDLEAFASKQGIKYEAIEISRQFSLKKDLIAIYRIARYIRKNNIDIIIAHYFPKCSLLVTLANLLAGNRCKILIAHGVLHDTMRGLMRKAVIWEQKFDVLFARKVVCVSQSVARRRREDGIDRSDKQTVLGNGSVNGVETQRKFNPTLVQAQDLDALKARYGIKPGDFVVGFCGRLVRDKGVTELCGAMRLLQERQPDKSIKLLIIGHKEQRDALPAETGRFLQDNETVIQTGAIPYSEIQNYYLLMDVLVLPSYREGFPTVVLEAGAMDVPAIVSRSTGCIDAIKEGVSGAFADLSPAAIAQAIERFLDDDYKKAFKGKTREYVVSFYDQRIVGENMLNFCNSIKPQVSQVDKQLANLKISDER